jgi:hypothetical protein
MTELSFNAAIYLIRRLSTGRLSETRLPVLLPLKAERASLAAQGRRIETEAAPIRCVAELIGADADSERLIALMVLCCDPLAMERTARLPEGNQAPFNCREASNHP